MTNQNNALEMNKVKKILSKFVFGEYFLLQNATTQKIDVAIFDNNNNRLVPFSVTLNTENEEEVLITDINEEDYCQIVYNGARASFSEDFQIAH